MNIFYVLKADAVRQKLSEPEDTADLERVIKPCLHLTKEAESKAVSVLRKLRTFSCSSPELSSTRSYIEFTISLL